MSKKYLKIVEDGESSRDYNEFLTINGTHPLKAALPAIYIPYQVRTLPNSDVVYFNFELAKEMGLLEKDHANELSRSLKKAILEAFSIRIINEYDILNDIKYDSKTIKPHTYMATRYLQLQHKNKQGKTSGDGRSIWNGCFESKDGTLWDISSRGTGATILSPAFAESQTPIQSGDDNVSYGCGCAELDEMYSSLILSEIFHKKNIPTERMLAIIDTKNGYCIGVRASKNLLRPAHFFRFLKQNDLKSSQSLINYHIQRQLKNKEWKFKTPNQNPFDLFLNEISHSFAKMVAILEEEYIFTWLDWDGDNILINGAILDYGSIRQFGVRHDAYRYDDDDRFSTNLNEQKSKARLIVQVFAQFCDFVSTGTKKNLRKFNNHPILTKFDKDYETQKQNHLLHKMGFRNDQINFLRLTHVSKIKEFSKLMYYFETKKIKNKIQRIEDGINLPPVFNMRNFLFEFSKNENQPYSAKNFVEKFKSSFARKKDLKIHSSLSKKITLFQKMYFQLLQITLKTQNARETFSERAQIINRPDRITGDASIMIVDRILTKVKRGVISFKDAQEIVEVFVEDQNLVPEYYEENPEKKLKSFKKKNLVLNFKKIVNHYREGI